MVIFHSFLYVYQRVLDISWNRGAGGIPGSLSDQGYSKTYEQASNIQDLGGSVFLCGYLNTETLGYPLVNIQKTMENHGKSPFLMGKSTINSHFQ
jgi:hypothetical protein